jgi:glutamate N-acetyltransferase/amino-acid N-acetyltransferase
MVMNSGAANAGTGPEGLTIAMLMAAEAASGLGCTAEHVLLAGTGAVEKSLPLDRVSTGIRLAVGMTSASGGAAAAEAIAAPGCVGHEHALTVKTHRGPFVVGGMATCCCAAARTTVPRSMTVTVLTTDAWVASSVLQHGLEQLVREESNGLAARAGAAVSDSIIALASGMSGVGIDDEEGFLALFEGLVAVHRELAARFVRDISFDASVS